MNPPEFPILLAPEPAHIGAHSHSSSHRSEILRSDLCGCFYCLESFRPAEILDWVDEPSDQPDGLGQTALCPHCGIDSVIGSAAGYPLTRDFLVLMQSHWF